MLEQLQSSPFADRFGAATVKAITTLTPHMVRITLAGELIRGFPNNCAGGHLKLIVPARGQNTKEFVNIIELSEFKSAMRTYTVRNARPETGEVDVDIVSHGDLGRVGPWAQKAQPGDDIIISKCGSPKLVTNQAERVLAAADLSSLPALAAGLETLDDDVAGEVFVEIPTPEDRQAIKSPDGINIHWIVKQDPYAPATQLIDAVTSSTPPEATTSVFAAGEFSTIATLRAYFKTQPHAEKAMSYISSYWKAGADEPGHKVAKAAAA